MRNRSPWVQSVKMLRRGLSRACGRIPALVTETPSPFSLPKLRGWQGCSLCSTASVGLCLPPSTKAPPWASLLGSALPCTGAAGKLAGTGSGRPWLFLTVVAPAGLALPAPHRPHPVQWYHECLFSDPTHRRPVLPGEPGCSLLWRITSPNLALLPASGRALKQQLLFYQAATHICARSSLLLEARDVWPAIPQVCLSPGGTKGETLDQCLCQPTSPFSCGILCAKIPSYMHAVSTCYRNHKLL